MTQKESNASIRTGTHAYFDLCSMSDVYGTTCIKSFRKFVKQFPPLYKQAEMQVLEE